MSLTVFKMFASLSHSLGFTVLVYTHAHNIHTLIHTHTLIIYVAFVYICLYMCFEVYKFRKGITIMEEGTDVQWEIELWAM